MSDAVAMGADGPVESETVDESSPPIGERSAWGARRYRIGGQPLGSFGDETGSADAAVLREHIEPYLSALFQSEHVNLLIGAGLMTGLTNLLPANARGDVPDMSGKLPPHEDDEPDARAKQLADDIEAAAKTAAPRTRPGEPNIEDRIRVAQEIAAGLSHLNDERSGFAERSVAQAIERLRDSVVGAEADLSRGRNARNESLGDLTVSGALTAFLGSLAARTSTRDRLHVFTTNYDRAIEWAAELSGLRVLDRFVGTLEPIFRSSRLDVDFHYSSPGAQREPRHLDGVIRLTKLHGSLDWKWDHERKRVVRVPSPFGSAPDVPSRELMVYPQASKDTETSGYPYAELFRDLSAALCRPHSVLVTFGYGFGDDHINRVITDMLTIPTTHLLVVSFDDRPGEGGVGRIQNFVDQNGVDGQVSVLLGPEVGSVDGFIKNCLPSPSSEFITQRRAQLYSDRGLRVPQDHVVDEISPELF